MVVARGSSWGFFKDVYAVFGGAPRGVGDTGTVKGTGGGD